MNSLACVEVGVGVGVGRGGGGGDRGEVGGCLSVQSHLPPRVLCIRNSA